MKSVVSILVSLAGVILGTVGITLTDQSNSVKIALAAGVAVVLVWNAYQRELTARHKTTASASIGLAKIAATAPKGDLESRLLATVENLFPGLSTVIPGAIAGLQSSLGAAAQTGVSAESRLLDIPAAAAPWSIPDGSGADLRAASASLRNLLAPTADVVPGIGGVIPGAQQPLPPAPLPVAPIAVKDPA